VQKKFGNILKICYTFNNVNKEGGIRVVKKKKKAKKKAKKKVKKKKKR